MLSISEKLCLKIVDIHYKGELQKTNFISKHDTSDAPLIYILTTHRSSYFIQHQIFDKGLPTLLYELEIFT